MTILLFHMSKTASSLGISSYLKRRCGVCRAILSESLVLLKWSVHDSDLPSVMKLQLTMVANASTSDYIFNMR